MLHFSPWSLLSLFSACAHGTPSLPLVSVVNTLCLAPTRVSRLRINSTSAASSVISPCFLLWTHWTKPRGKQLSFFFVFLNWSVIASQCCISFCCESAVCPRVFLPTAPAGPSQSAARSPRATAVSQPRVLHVAVLVPVLLPVYPTFSFPSLCPQVCLYISVSVPALQIGSLVPFLWIPYACANIQYLFFWLHSVWLILGSSTSL